MEKAKSPNHRPERLIFVTKGRVSNQRLTTIPNNRIFHCTVDGIHVLVVSTNRVSCGILLIIRLLSIHRQYHRQHPTEHHALLLLLVKVIRSNTLHVAIIGGGIGGLALATALQHRNICCQVYEKEDLYFTQRSQGYGLTLQQARKALLALGIRDDYRRGCDIHHSTTIGMSSFLNDHAVTSTKHVVHTADGRVIGEWGLRKWMGRPEEPTLGKDNMKGTEKKKKHSSPPKRQNLHVPRQALRYALWEALEATLLPSNHSIISWGHKLVDNQIIVIFPFFVDCWILFHQECRK